MLNSAGSDVVVYLTKEWHLHAIRLRSTIMLDWRRVKEILVIAVSFLF